MQFVLLEVGNTICLDTSVQKTTGHAGKGISLKAVTDYMSPEGITNFKKLPFPEKHKRWEQDRFSLWIKRG